MAVDWLQIKTDYINGLGSYRKLAEQHGVSVDAVKKRAAAEGWREARTNFAPKLHQKVQEKTAEVIAEKEANRVARILSLSDRLADRIEQALKELNQTQAIQKTKVRELEYKDPDAKGKPTKEVIREEEQILAVTSIVDRRGLQQVATALKTAWDIAGAASDPGEDIEDDGLLKALKNVATDLFEDGDDSVILPEESE
jgi:predicted house-cleaning noncanonical NTP pyrophosphatase (MazG superfamily)